MRDHDIKEFGEFILEFQAETDRGAALVGAAMLDQRLYDTFQGLAIIGKTTDELLNGATAPLGTFSAKIKICHALGLIDNFELSELNLIRKIRNEFAHSVHGTTFLTPKIRAYCEMLQCDLPGKRKEFLENPRSIFINSVIVSVVQLTYRSEWVSKERRTTKTWP